MRKTRHAIMHYQKIKVAFGNKINFFKLLNENEFYFVYNKSKQPPIFTFAEFSCNFELENEDVEVVESKTLSQQVRFL